MSRRPTAVSLNTKKNQKPASSPQSSAKQNPVGTDKKSRDNKRENETSRKPRAMKAPKVEHSDEELSLPDFPGSQLVSEKRSKLGLLFLSSIVALVSLGMALWFAEVIEGLFAKHEWLGWGATGLLVFALVSLAFIILREILALWRLRKLASMREDVIRTLDDRTFTGGASTLRDLFGLYRNRKDMQWHLSRVESYENDVMDNRDRMVLAERQLMKPLDAEAKRIVANAAKRISVLTAINPAPSLDVLFTGYQILSMLRRLTALYGNRPGSVGTLKLAGMVGSHLAVTGGLALSDSLLQQLLGKGLAGRLSAKLGEGTVNGIMTARIGIAAMELCRPMPFREIGKPGLKEFFATIMGSIRGSEDPETHS